MSVTTHRSSGGVSDLTKGSYSSGRKSNNEDVITVAAAADFNYHSFPSLSSSSSPTTPLVTGPVGGPGAAFISSLSFPAHKENGTRTTVFRGSDTTSAGTRSLKLIKQN